MENTFSVLLIIAFVLFSHSYHFSLAWFSQSVFVHTLLLFLLLLRSIIFLPSSSFHTLTNTHTCIHLPLVVPLLEQAMTENVCACVFACIQFDIWYYYILHLGQSFVWESSIMMLRIWSECAVLSILGRTMVTQIRYITLRATGIWIGFYLI